MITKKQAMNLKSGDIVFHVDGVGLFGFAGYGGSICKVRKLKITSKCKTWVRRPEDWQLQYKFGLRAYGTIGTRADSLNPNTIYLTEQEADDALMLHNIQSKLKE